MFLENKKLKIVIIDHPIFVLDNQFCATLIGKALKMKRDSYSMTYHENILPMDKTDFFGTHVMLCEEIQNEYFPIFAYKSVTLERCIQYDFEFPIYSIMRSDCHQKCLIDINNVINQINDYSSVSYDSCLAKNIDYRLSGDLNFKKILQEITMMTIVKYHNDYNIPHMINLGVVKVQTDQFFLRLGLKKINEHAHLNFKSLNNEECVLFYNNYFSEEANQMAWKYKKLWDSKLVINGIVQKRKVGRAA